MTISNSDREFMQKVAEYYQSTKSLYPGGSINATAEKFGINRSKVRKILVTMGELQSPVTDQAVKLREQGMTIKEIAFEMNMSVSTVSSYLPYEREIHNTLEPSDHAAEMREYRAYQKAQAERQVQKKAEVASEVKNENPGDWKAEWKKEVKLSYTETDSRPPRPTWEDFEQKWKELEKTYTQPSESFQRIEAQFDAEIREYKELREKAELTDGEKERFDYLSKTHGYFKGALSFRNIEELEALSGEKIPYQPLDVLHLHLELRENWSDSERSVLQKYGGLTGQTISRDVVVPVDMPLYAIHYMIQRLFGWQNSHLHQFSLDEKELEQSGVKTARDWKSLVGILFRSPLMGEGEEFWADDYNGGSFKNWLTKKYTGPYLSQCWGEGFVACDQDMMSFPDDEEYYVQFCKRDGEVFSIDCIPVYRFDGKKNKKPARDEWLSGEQWVEKLSFSDLPMEALRLCFDRDYKALLERLPIWTVLRPLDDVDPASNLEELMEEFGWEIDELRDSGIDSPSYQVEPYPLGSTLYYNYDFGDDWWIEITATFNCEEMVESGMITQEQLDKANIKCRELYRPVTIAVDGEMLIDDVGGTGGFIEFLETINPDLDGMDKEEKADARREKKENLEWAKGLGWHKLSPWI